MTTLPTTTPDTRVEMLNNENRNLFNNSETINMQHNTYDGNEPQLIEDARITVTKDLFLCRICYNCDQIERFVNNAFSAAIQNLYQNNVIIKVSILISVQRL